jgi:MFS family permease
MVETAPARGRGAMFARDHPRYRWIVLSNTTLGMLMATVNGSIVLISLPAIFTGIHLNPLEPGNVTYLLWMLMGFILVTAVLVMCFGRLGDLYGHVKVYNLGFLVFSIAAVALVIDFWQGSPAALWLIGWRIVQAVGASMIFANSTAILTDAFPPARRGFALGVNQIAATAGTFIGLILGGLLAALDWHIVFLASVPFGILGTIWSYVSLHEIAERGTGRVDWWGNIVFTVGLVALLTGITYGIQPYGGSSMGWGNPWVLAAIIGGALLLLGFVFLELRVKDPMFNMKLFRSAAFAWGNVAGLLAAIGRGGLQFMLIIWLQGIWLPLHGYSYESTPFWAGIYLLPLTIGFLAAGPLSGAISDRIGARMLATVGCIVTAATFVLLLAIPVNFDYWLFALLIFFNGVGSGMFAAPNRAAIMNAVPAGERGAASGMSGTFQNAGNSLSIGIFFSLMIAGLAASLPRALTAGLTAHGVSQAAAAQLSALPPVGSLFAAFLGYNPIQSLLGPDVLHALSPADAATLTGKSFFPKLISAPFSEGLAIVFIAAAVMSLVAAAASVAMGRRYVHDEGADAAAYAPAEELSDV